MNDEFEPDVPPQESTQYVHKLHHPRKQDRKPYFEIAEQADGTWAWCLWASNGIALAESGRKFPRKNECAVSCSKLMENLGKEPQIFIRENAHKK